MTRSDSVAAPKPINPESSSFSFATLGSTSMRIGCKNVVPASVTPNEPGSATVNGKLKQHARKTSASKSSRTQISRSGKRASTTSAIPTIRYACFHSWPISFVAQLVPGALFALSERVCRATANLIKTGKTGYVVVDTFIRMVLLSFCSL